MSRRSDTEISYEHLVATKGHGVDPWNIFVQMMPHFVDRVRSERKMAASHRKFNVAALLQVVDPATSRHGILLGANTKPHKYKEKVCAEARIFGRAQRLAYTHPIALIVSGPRNVDHGSGLHPQTLHPCETCRPMIAENAPDDLLIMTVDPEIDRYQIQTARELFDLHVKTSMGQEVEEPTTFYDPGFQDWQETRLLYSLLNSRIRSVEGASSPAEFARIALTGYFNGQPIEIL